jgi:predicted permease
MWSDLKYVARSLRKAPVFTIAVVLTLAFGIGANTAIFSVVHAVILEPFAYAGADRLVAVHETVRRASVPLPVNATHFLRWREASRSFEGLALLREISVNLTGAGEPERLTAGRVSATLFPMLGVRMQLGRAFVEEEDLAGRDRVVVVTDELWRRRFAADPAIVGRPVLLDNEPYVVVGVLPADFRFPRFSDLYPIDITSSQPQIWKPFGLRDEERAPFGDFNYACVAKLRPGVTEAQAASELRGLQADIDATFQEKVGLDAIVLPLARQVASRARTGLLLLFAASGVVLLIACVNVASLLVGRSSARRRELAVRKAIGATSGRLVANAMTECAALGLLAAALGIGIGYWTIRAIAALAPADLPRVNDFHLDLRVLLFAIAVSMLTTILMGLVPAWRAAQSDSLTPAGGSRTSTAGRRTTTLRSLLVASEIGLSTVSLVAAGLLLHSFARLMSVDKGFDVERLMLVDLTLSPRRYPNVAATSAFVLTALDQLSAQPGIVSTSVISQPPLAGVGGNNLLLAEDAHPSAQPPTVDFRPISPAYFATMGIPLRRGRLFGDSDHGQQRVAVISEGVASRVWPGQNPVGKRFRLGGMQTALIDVVGTVGDIRGASLSDNPSPTVYLPYWQRAFNRNRVSLVVKTTAGPAATAAVVRLTIHRLDPEMAVPTPRTMDDVVDASTAGRRFQLGLVLLFALTALLLASLGTYGVISYSVIQRTNEIGIRLALGAAPGRVLRDVIVGAMRLVAGGLAVGLPLAVGAAYAMRTLLFGVVPHDGLTLAGVAAALMVVGIVAAFVPAWRAGRIDPLVALRAE